MCGKKRMKIAQGEVSTSPCLHVRFHTISGINLVRKVHTASQLHTLYLRLLRRRGVSAAISLFLYMGIVTLGGELFGRMSLLLELCCMLYTLVQCVLLPTGIAHIADGHVLDVYAGDTVIQEEVNCHGR